ncbi:MAG: pyrimidine 5'-nucleotidase [Deferribacterales bacterium]
MNFVFDLDNTIYNQDQKVLDIIDDNINRFMTKHLGIDETSVDELRQRYRKDYGITLKGLMLHHNVAPYDYLEFVHNLDYKSILKKDEQLYRILKDIPHKKYIFTNGSKKHAINVLSNLGILELFQKIISIEDTDYTPKPSIESFNLLCSNLKIEPGNSFFIDDMIENIKTASNIGFKTIHIDPTGMSNIGDFTFKNIYEIEKLTKVLQ